ANSAAFHQAENKIDRVVVALCGKGEAAVWSGGAEIGIERNLARCAGTRRERCSHRMDDRAQECRKSGQSTKSCVSRLPGGSGEDKLRADFTGKRTGGLRHARVDLHLLRFPVDLAQQVVDL